ncbi:MAG: type IX secretion system outer membrane channel protein PorV [Flavobacteriales bacterium]|nr:type IX secretion system outer membrane channel protein PorV [Flavobacteriales bacterium]
MNLRKSFKIGVVAVSAMSLTNMSFGQISTGNLTGESGQQINTITTAVPFLLIAPDSRSSAMGDAGVAINPDANSTHWNASKLSFIDDKDDFGVSISYSPWLRQLVNDINLAYLSGYKKIDKNSAIGVSMRYFSLGNITFTDITGNTIRDFKPNEFAFDVAYSRKLSQNFGTAVALRYINSNLTGGISTTGGETQAGRSVAADVSLFYQGNEFKMGEIPSNINFGLNISNIGAKMAYTSDAEKDFIPTNLRLGTALNMEIDEYNKLTFAFDANKLLVPTQPIYQLEGGEVVTDGDGNPIIYSGKDPNVGTAAGMFQSFIDAPGVVIYEGDSTSAGIESGSKFKEELNEINLSLGAEYWYSDIFAVRAGYFHEHWSKGNRRFISLGAGVKYQALQLDLSYLLSLTQNSPIANTVRFTLKFAFGKTGGSSAEG